jgi:hypothetical protein
MCSKFHVRLISDFGLLEIMHSRCSVSLRSRTRCSSTISIDDVRVRLWFKNSHRLTWLILETILRCMNGIVFIATGAGDKLL